MMLRTFRRAHRLLAPPLPPSVNYHLTATCNYGCDFCFATFNDVPKRLPAASSAARPRGTGAAAAQTERMVLVARRLGEAFSKVTFAGGEPTLIGALGQLLEAAKVAGATTNIVTNGFRLAGKLPVARHTDAATSCTTSGIGMGGTNDLERVAAEVQTDPRWRLLRSFAPFTDWLTISIDSTSPDTHRRLGRRLPSGGLLQPDDYLALAAAARALGVRVKVNTVVTTLNAMEGDMGWFVARLGAERWKVFQALPVEGQNYNVTGVASQPSREGDAAAAASSHGCGHVAPPATAPAAAVGAAAVEGCRQPPEGGTTGAAGENTTTFTPKRMGHGDARGDVRQLLITRTEFVEYVERNRALAEAGGVVVVPEDNEAMTGSYAMVDPAGRSVTRAATTHIRHTTIRLQSHGRIQFCQWFHSRRAAQVSHALHRRQVCVSLLCRSPVLPVSFFFFGSLSPSCMFFLRATGLSSETCTNASRPRFASLHVPLQVLRQQPPPSHIRQRKHRRRRRPRGVERRNVQHGDLRQPRRPLRLGSDRMFPQPVASPHRAPGARDLPSRPQ